MRSRFRFLAAAVALAALVPSMGHAEASRFTAPYQGSHQGGDSFNNMSADPATGAVQILRVQFGAPNGSLGCNASGGFVELEQVVSHDEPISEVTASYTDALVGAFGFIKLAVRKDGEPIQASVARGPIQGAGIIKVSLTDLEGNPTSVAGPLTLWFGVEVSGACPPSPPFEFARATFTTLAVE